MLPAHTLSGLLRDYCNDRIRQDIRVSGLALDSRKVQAGDLFLAVAGTQTHGLQHARQAIALGAVAVAWEPVEGNTALAEAAALLPATTVAVSGLGRRVGLIADRFYGHPSRGMFMIGVTGTDGKTSVSHFIAQALNSPERRCGMIGTLGYGLYAELQQSDNTTPDALTIHRCLQDMQLAGARCVVSEVSSHAMDQGRVNGVYFDVAVLTNLSRDHLDYHGNVEAYAEAKRKLFHSHGLRYAVINADDPFGSALLDAIPPGVAPVAYRLENEPFRTRFPAQWVIGRNLHMDVSGMQFDVVTPWGSGHIECGLLGRFNASNLLAALASLCVAGLPFAEALRRLGATRTVAGRMERFDAGADHPLVVVDYAHTSGALEAVLDSLRAHCSGKLWCVFGAGGDRDRGKRAQMGAVAERHADHVVLTDDNPRTEDPQQIIEDICSGVRQPNKLHIEHDRGKAIARAMHEAGADDIVLVAGKGHETVQLVGNRALPFSDRERVMALTREWTQ
ncbi:MAG: UDP-N-acetylmuramoyl-L-alanyl-D-glutamate--2,6-diaminopimelate ligase [Gammaproteobacteria bacterium]|nr:UDP-N-acetylmuramoyl-L-alanyl-D-glutamate--2,6-diaminopimelate ligase [Gammaproteobacteria bacterium]